jgi:hypothetical protein
MTAGLDVPASFSSQRRIVRKPRYFSLDHCLDGQPLGVNQLPGSVAAGVSTARNVSVIPLTTMNTAPTGGRNPTGMRHAQVGAAISQAATLGLPVAVVSVVTNGRHRTQRSPHYNRLQRFLSARLPSALFRPDTSTSSAVSSCSSKYSPIAARRRSLPRRKRNRATFAPLYCQ